MKPHKKVLAHFTLATAFTISLSRWGSHIQIAGLYLTDLIIAFGLLNFVLFSLSSRKLKNAKGNSNYLVWLLFYLVILNLLFSSTRTLETLRDAFPYLYLCLAIPIATQIGISFNRTFKLLLIALRIHAIWYSLSFIFKLGEMLPFVPNSPGVRFLEIRGDFDPMLGFVYVLGIATRYLLKLRLSVLDRFLLPLTLIALSGNNSRAALISFFLMLIVVLKKAKYVKSIKYFSILSLSITTLITISILGVKTPLALDRLLSTSTIVANADYTSVSASSNGTLRARISSWQILLNYSTENRKRLLLGVGPGRNFMAETGAGRALISSYGGNQTSPRSPHNFLLNTLLRFGLIGLILEIVILIVTWRRVKFCERNIEDKELEFHIALMQLLYVGILSSAMFGVVLESPFGAISLGWLIGIAANLKAEAVRKS